MSSSLIPNKKKVLPKKFLKIVRPYLPYALIIAIVTFALGWPQYAFATVRCGKPPIIANRFASAYSYSVPGEKYYSPNIFSEYFCSPSEAELNGFHPNPLNNL